MKTFLDVIKSGFLISISVTVWCAKGKTIFGSFPIYSRMSISPHLGQPTSLILEPNIQKLAIHLDQLAALPQNDRIEILFYLW
jgi:hypothetical protein